MRTKEIRKFYEEYPMGEPTNEHVLVRHDMIKKYIKKIEQPRTLEIGCGKGFLAKKLVKNTKKHYAFDLSKNAITFAKNMHYDKKLSFFVADATEIPSKGEKFDLVICSEVLEHIPDYRKTISGISRVLNKNGFCIITLPNYYDPIIFIKMLIKGKNSNQVYDNPVPYKKLIKAFNKCNLNLNYRNDFYLGYPFRSKIPKKLLKYFDGFFSCLRYKKLYLFLVFKKV